MNIILNSSFKNAKQTNKRYRVIVGGAGSGKSYFIAQETIINMMDNADYSYLVVRKTGRSIRNSVFQLLQTLISDYNLSSIFQVNKSDMTIHCNNGARLVTSGLDDVEKLKSITGINRIWVEEANEISESDFNQLDLRLRGKNKLGYQMTLTFNPVSELHWLKKRFFDIGDPDAFTSRTTYKDNLYLDDQYKVTLERLKDEDYQYYRIYALGEWGSIGNLVYTNWAKEEIPKEVKYKFDNYFNGLDWGFADDPFALIRVHFDKTRKIIYVTDEICQTGLHNDESAELTKEIVGSDYVVCDSAEPKSISDFRRLGVRSRGAKKGPGSIEYGIKWIQSQKIVVDTSCTNTIKELTAYKYREDKDGNVIPKPLDKNNHLLDALRYALEEEMSGKRVGFLK